MGIDVKKVGGKGAAIAEEQRDKRPHTGFMADLFRGKANFKLFPRCVPNGDDPTSQFEEWQKTEDLLAKLREFLITQVNPQTVEETDRLSNYAMEWLCENGFFGLKLPKEYGGSELGQESYMQIMQLAASWCGGVVAALSAANTIGVGWPLKAYGTPDQKEKYLPTVAKSPSGFSFTEKEAGSDPSNMRTYAKRIRDDEGNLVGYRITGKKWWTTNGPKADGEFLSPLLCLIAKTVDEPEDLDDENYKPCFSAFVIPTGGEGLTTKRCQFEGLRGMYNGETTYDNVWVAADQLIGGQEGTGFKIALEALNTGRITVAGSCTAIVKQCLHIGKWWANERQQWGKNIGKHEAVGSGMLAAGMADALAMEAMTWFAAFRSDKKLDSRMEAAACKIFASERGWKIVDDLLQMRGGRGYETAKSLKERGESPIPVEQIHRSFRPNRIFEGATELLAQWVIREGVDEFKKRGEVFFEKGNWWKKMKAMLVFGKDLIKFSLPSVPYLSLSLEIAPLLEDHLTFVKKNAKKLARSIIWNSAKYRAKLTHKQLLFLRWFWIATELYAMSAVCYYDWYRFFRLGLLVKNYEQFAELADFYCREARLRIENLFRSIKNNNDGAARKVADNTLDGLYDQWLKDGIIPIVDELKLEKSG